MAGPTGIEPASPDRQSGIVAIGPWPHIGFGALDRTRTYIHQIRNLGLFPVELQTRDDFGASEGTRTPDIRLGRTALYQLSYTRINDMH